jgi:hypothetical protein
MRDGGFQTGTSFVIAHRMLSEEHQSPDERRTRQYGFQVSSSNVDVLPFDVRNINTLKYTKGRTHALSEPLSDQWSPLRSGQMHMSWSLPPLPCASLPKKKRVFLGFSG